ncbi:hypothetical protein DL98DRAFT_208575 [Cadophora sp. DSE1049]|nr:hypothetical protein DL98DRAFT_208575 [Cadophora sp. DSE1049]
MAEMAGQPTPPESIPTTHLPLYISSRAPCPASRDQVGVNASHTRKSTTATRSSTFHAPSGPSRTPTQTQISGKIIPPPTKVFTVNFLTFQHAGKTGIENQAVYLSTSTCVNANLPESKRNPPHETQSPLTRKPPRLPCHRPYFNDKWVSPGTKAPQQSSPASSLPSKKVTI